MREAGRVERVERVERVAVRWRAMRTEPPDVAEMLATVRTLRDVGRYEDYLDAARTLAREHPSEVLVRLEAAYACDSFGAEHDAIAHYDAAQALGVPDEKRREFSLGYGSTLRNVGRTSEALSVLSAAVRASPEDRGLRALLALALLSAGRAGCAVAELLDVALSLADPQTARDFCVVDRALAHYRDQLRALSAADARVPPAP